MSQCCVDQAIASFANYHVEKLWNCGVVASQTKYSESRLEPTGGWTGTGVSWQVLYMKVQQQDHQLTRKAQVCSPELPPSCGNITLIYFVVLKRL